MNLDGLRPWGGLVDGHRPDVVVAGIAYDGSAVYRKGAALAPQRIRQLSAVMPPVTEVGRLLTALHVEDIGDLSPGSDIESGWMGPMERLARIPPEAFLTVLGGDHCTAISTLAAQVQRHPGLHVLWVDAHPDLCDFSRGGRWTCGCALRRALEASGIEPSRVVIAGGRDFDPEEIDFIKANDVLLVTSADIARDPDGAAGRIAERLRGSKVHVSFDIDVLDPAFAPGTEIPSAGGLSSRQALELLRGATAGASLVGLDIVEVSPP
ncbi:MAG TPA: arginase family protein, partial [Candidatus Dormibacteraeota bacterium]|nr:arginase family protein [Candidatus Dormibacteraeota bacterium]